MVFKKLEKTLTKYFKAQILRNPDIIEVFDDDSCFLQWVNNKGETHRIDGPSVIYYDRNHYQLIWHREGKLYYDINQPNKEYYNFDDNYFEREWWRNGKIVKYELVTDYDFIILEGEECSPIKINRFKTKRSIF